MPCNDGVRKYRWALLFAGLGLLLAGLLCYRSYAPEDSFVRSSNAPSGWFIIVTFIVVGVIVRLVRASYQKHDAENDRRNEQRTDQKNP